MAMSPDAHINAQISENGDGFTISQDVPGASIFDKFWFPTRASARQAIKLAYEARRAGRWELQEELRKLLNVRER